MPRRHLWFATVTLLLTSHASFADFGWMPKYKGLFFRGGADFMTSGDNYNTDGVSEPIRNNGQLSRFTEFRLWLEPEYSFAPEWSVRMKADFVTASVNPDLSTTTSTSNSGTGLGDITLGLRKSFKNAGPSITAELKAKFAPYSNYISSLDQLVLGDGNFDLGAIVHVGYSGKGYFFAASPEMLFRMGGYSSGFNFKGGGGVRYNSFYAMILMSTFIPFGEQLLFDTSLAVHDAGGTGGSYARLSASPFSYDMGIRGGVRVGKSTFIEGTLMKSLIGRRAPNYFQFGINLFMMSDFYEPDKRPKVIEVPFEGSQEVPAAQPPPIPPEGQP